MACLDKADLDFSEFASQGRQVALMRGGVLDLNTVNFTKFRNIKASYKGRIHGAILIQHFYGLWNLRMVSCF